MSTIEGHLRARAGKTIMENVIKKNKTLIPVSDIGYHENGGVYPGGGQV